MYQLTIIDKMRSYQADATAVCKLVQPELEAAIAAARTTKQPVQEVILCRYAGKNFVCLLSAKALIGHVVVFQMLPAPAGFEMVAYHPVEKQYYFFEAHFFRRYAQRLKVQHWQPVDIFRHYVTHNPLLVVEMPAADKRLRHHFLAMTNTGLIHAMKEASNVIVCTTLINRFKLSKRQLQETRSLRAKFFEKRRRALLA